MSKGIPMLAHITYLMAEVTYCFFTPWYLRLWHRIRGYRCNKPQKETSLRGEG